MFCKHAKKLFFALATFFWAGCSDDNSASVDVLYGCPDGVCGDPTPLSSNSDTFSNIDTESSNLVEPNSSSSLDDNIPPMSAACYGVVPVDTVDTTTAVTPIQCFTTSIKDASGSSHAIFECENGNRYLKDFVIYSDGLREKLPKDIKWAKPDMLNGEGANCVPGPALCVDKVDANGNIYGGCAPTIECPYKEN